MSVAVNRDTLYTDFGNILPIYYNETELMLHCLVETVLLKWKKATKHIQMWDKSSDCNIEYTQIYACS